MSYGFKRFRLGVQPLNPNRISNGGRDNWTHHTTDYYETIVEARDIREAERQVYGRHGGSANVRIHNLGQV